MISYAQNFEDVLLWRALKHIPNGFYIDIGAWSPDNDSVTRWFYESGWSGINVEPNEFFAKQLRARRLRDINLSVAVSDQPGELDFFLIDNSGLSTVERPYADRLSNSEFSLNVTRVPSTTLASIWHEHIPREQQVHFLKIDVEGHESRVLIGADWANHRPWIIVIEATEPNSTTTTHHLWEERLLEAGYHFCWFDGLNRFYAAHEHYELTKLLCTPPNLFDNFKKASEFFPEGASKIRREDVVDAYLSVLGRPPESEEIIAEYMGKSAVGEVYKALCNSHEFQLRRTPTQTKSGFLAWVRQKLYLNRC